VQGLTLAVRHERWPGSATRDAAWLLDERHRQAEAARDLGRQQQVGRPRLRVARLPPLGDVESARYWPDPDLEIEAEPDSGHALVTVEWRIDPSDSEDFAEAMTPLRRSRQQTGATRWGAELP
jgi:hypothetical protein